MQAVVGKREWSARREMKWIIFKSVQIERQTEIDRDRREDRQTEAADRQTETDRQTDRDRQQHTNGQTDRDSRQANRDIQTDRKTDTHTQTR